MGLFDEIKGKAEDLVGSNKDKIHDGIEKGGDFVDDHTGGKFKDQVDQGQDAANGYVDRLSGGEDNPDQNAEGQGQ